MRNLSTEVKVGIFAIVAALLAVFFTSRTGDIPGFLRGKEGYVLYAEPENVSGIEPKTAVQIAGVQVGIVEEVKLVEGQARLKLRLSRDVRLPLDSRVVIQPKGALGSKVVSIVPGQAAMPPRLEEGDVIRTGKPPPDFDQMIKRVDDVTQDIREVTASLRDTLGSEEAEERISSILTNIERFSENMARVSATNQRSVNEIVENMRVLSEQLRRTADQTSEGVDSSFEDLRRAADRLDATLTSVSSVASKIDDGEGTLGQLVNNPSTANSLEEAVGGVNEVVDSINRIKVFVDYHGEALAGAPTFGFGEEGFALKNYLGVRIQPAPDYYYNLELVDDPEGLVTESETTFTELDEDGNVVEERTVRERKVENDYKVTLQMARRLRNATFRLGIKESTGGVGVDYHLLDDRARLSLDAYEFSRPGENPNLKLMARYDVHKHIFVLGGADDMISARRQQRYFLGAGVTFNDDDLKWIIGSIPTP